MVKGIKTIALRYTEEEFNILKELKDSAGLSWELFVLNNILNKVEPKQILEVKQ